MQISVVFTTQLKATLGQSQATVQLADGGTVADAIAHLREQHPDAFSQLVTGPTGELLPSILVCVNDQQQIATHPLQDGDTVTLLSAISGG